MCSVCEKPHSLRSLDEACSGNSGPEQVARKAQHFAVALVAGDHPVVGIEHDEAVEHGRHRRIELTRAARKLAIARIRALLVCLQLRHVRLKEQRGAVVQTAWRVAHPPAVFRPVKRGLAGRQSLALREGEELVLGIVLDLHLSRAVDFADDRFVGHAYAQHPVEVGTELAIALVHRHQHSVSIKQREAVGHVLQRLCQASTTDRVGIATDEMTIDGLVVASLEVTCVHVVNGFDDQAGWTLVARYAHRRHLACLRSRYGPNHRGSDVRLRPIPWYGFRRA